MLHKKESTSEENKFYQKTKKCKTFFVHKKSKISLCLIKGRATFTNFISSVPSIRRFFDVI